MDQRATPCACVSKPKEPRGRVRHLDERERKALAKAVAAGRDEPESSSITTSYLLRGAGHLDRCRQGESATAIGRRGSQEGVAIVDEKER